MYHKSGNFQENDNNFGGIEAPFVKHEVLLFTASIHEMQANSPHS